jgi:hypothetical protein
MKCLKLPQRTSQRHLLAQQLLQENQLAWGCSSCCCAALQLEQLIQQGCGLLLCCS